MRLKYNSPVILTFTLISTMIHLLNQYVFTINNYFTVPGTLIGAGAPEYMGIVTHILGHSGWEHLLGNFSLILLLGPILEEKYGSGKILLMILITALATGVLNILFLDTGLLGASGIVFMLILLSSITNYKNGDIPITFILVVILYLGKEVWSSFDDDQVSQFGHILGGIFGAIFGFLINRKVIREQTVVNPTSSIPDVNDPINEERSIYSEASHSILEERKSNKENTEE